MLRMEIALFLVMGFIAYVYFSAGRKNTPLHRTFSVLLIVVLIHLILDGVTVYTVHHLETVPRFLNDTVHRLFLGSMVFVIYLFYQYIAILVEEETGKPRRLVLPAIIFLVVAQLGNFLLPISYTLTPDGNYSSGPYMMVPYGAVAFYLLLCAELLASNLKHIDKKKKFAIGVALLIELTVCSLQGLNHTWLISGMGIVLMTLSFYLTLENPDILRAELNCEYDIDPDLGGVQVPNFILQPIVENSLLHGLKNKGYKGKVSVSAHKLADGKMEILVCDTGNGFAEGKKEAIDQMLLTYSKYPAKLEGNSIGILNVQKRIKLLCGREYGLSYTENSTGGVTAHLLLPLREEVK